MPDTNVDIINQGQAHGAVAAHLMSNGRLDIGSMKPFIGNNGQMYKSIYMGGDPNELTSYTNVPVANATLRRDEWKRLDTAVMKIFESRLRGAEDLISRGLTYDLGNGMGSTILESHDLGDALEAELTMDGLTRGKNDRPNFQYNYLPLPIIHADYEINTRALNASRNQGSSLDTIMAERASRKVAEKLEAMFFTNTSYAYGELDSRSRNSIYSYLNHPDRNTGSLHDSWDDSAATAANMIKDVLAMKQVLMNKFIGGPYALYIPLTYDSVIDVDYDARTPGTTIRERIEKINGIDSVRIVDTLPTDNVLLVSLQSDVVRLVRGMGIQNVQWMEEGNMITKYKVMTIQVPQIRSDQNGSCGIAHYTGS